MKSERSHELEASQDMAQKMLTLLPLARKRLLRLDVIQKTHRLPYSHIQVLSLLQQHGNLSVSEISRRLGIAKPNITPLVDRLYEAGYVMRTHDMSDRRVVNVSLLAEGAQALQEIEQEMSRQIQEQVRILNTSELRELTDAITSMSRILERL